MKYKRLQGYSAPYIPGWDTHGLPIELKVGEKLGKKVEEMSELDIKLSKKNYALEFVEKQKADFVRLGVLR